MERIKRKIINNEFIDLFGFKLSFSIVFENYEAEPTHKEHYDQERVRGPSHDFKCNGNRISM
jgi:hypothetical protein